MRSVFRGLIVLLVDYYRWVIRERVGCEGRRLPMLFYSECSGFFVLFHKWSKVGTLSGVIGLLIVILNLYEHIVLH